MTILDTSIVINLIKNRKTINEDLTIITLAEFPPILEYSKFNGKITHYKFKNTNTTNIYH